MALLGMVSFLLLVVALSAGNVKLTTSSSQAQLSAISAPDLNASTPPPPLAPLTDRQVSPPPSPQSQPPPPQPPPGGQQFEQRHIEKLTEVLTAAMTPDFASGSQLDPPLKHVYGMIGNAHSGAEVVVALGQRARDSAATSGDYIRWSAFSQVAASVLLMKAIEEGLLSYDDEVRTYFPEMDSDNLQKLCHDPVTNLPNGTERVVVQTTIRHLMTFRSGRTYLFWRQGSYLLPGLFGSIAIDEEFMWSVYPELAQNMATGVTSTGACPSSDASLMATVGLPLVHIPGNEPRLGNDYAIVGAVIAGALRAKNHTLRTASEYLRAKVLDPLGMADTWVARAEDPPADVRERLAGAFIMRMGPPGQLNDGHMDPLPLNGVPDDYTYGLQSNFFEPTFLEDVPGDSYYCIAQGSYLAPANASNDHYGASGLETSLTGTMQDLGTFIRMLAKGGVADDGTRVVSQQSIDFLKQPTTDPDTEQLRYFQGGGDFGFALPDQHAYSLLGGVPSRATALQYPTTATTFTYTSYYGLTLYIDTHTGTYGALTTSAPSTADGLWAVQEKRKRALEVFKVASMG
jgi:CubicO group peptidase (beta-lactamase class C family)